MRFHTGQANTVSGDFEFDGYMDGTWLPSPTSKEQVIPLDSGETFPPIRSCDKACYWRLIRRA